MDFRGSEHACLSSNPKVGGTVTYIGVSKLSILDGRTGRRYSLDIAKCRPMTNDEIGRHHDARRKDDLPQQVLIKRRLEVMATWTKRDERRAKRGLPERDGTCTTSTA